MSTPVRVAGFLAGLVLAFVAALGVGEAVGPVGDPDGVPVDEHRQDDGDHEQMDDHEEGSAP